MVGWARVEVQTVMKDFFWKWLEISKTIGGVGDVEADFDDEFEET